MFSQVSGLCFAVRYVCGEYHERLAPPQFAFHFLTRAIGFERIKERDPHFVGAVQRWWQERHGDADPLAGYVAVTPIGRVARRAEGRVERRCGGC